MSIPITITRIMDNRTTNTPIMDTQIILDITMAGFQCLAPFSSGASITAGTTDFITDSMTVVKVWAMAPVRV